MTLILSVPLILSLQGISLVDECIVNGVCGSGPARTGPHSGIMFLAVGLVWLGIAGLRRLDRNPPG